MKPPRPQAARRALLLAGALAGAGSLAGCASNRWLPPPMVPVPAPSVSVGDRWRYLRIDRYSGYALDELTMTVALVEPRVVVRVADSGGKQLADEIYANPWRVFQDPAQDIVMRFRDPAPLLPSPLAAGARENFASSYTTPDLDRPRYWSETVVAEGWELVRVPAGEFVALRVSRRIAFEHPDHFRQNNSREETLWYSPRVNRWVAREWTGRYRWPGMRREMPLRDAWVSAQLVEYTRAP